MQKAILYVHGKGGSHLEAQLYQKSCPEFYVIGIDYDDYLPWTVQSQFQSVYDKIQATHGRVFLIANSLGAYLSVHALQNCEIEKALFVSPILDMERLILDMMDWAHVSEQDLSEKGEIPTDFGEILSYEYLCFVREHPVTWEIPTEILYAGQDTLTSRHTIDQFLHSHNAKLTVLENGEHWFHTEEQLAFLDRWVRKALL
ncbi:MAG: alpha/beta hydrolase [Blautia sp.]